MTRAAIYCRVSTDKQEKEGTSLETQEEACRKYAAAKGYAIVGEPYLEVYTGTALYERKRLSALREAIRAKAVDIVIAYSIDRLSRDANYLGVILSEADHKNVKVEFVSEPLDDSPEGQLIRYIRGYSAKIEHEKIKERSKRGREKRARDGKPIPGGSEPLGYKWKYLPVRGKPGEPTRFTVAGYEIDPDKAPLARRIFQDVANGISVTKLAEAFNREGIPTQKGGRQWHHTTLRAILRNPIYKGEYETLRKQYDTDKGKRSKVKNRPESERVKIPGIAPALVTPDLWQAANDQLARNRTESRRPGLPAETYLLRAGFIRCGYCGGSVTAGIIRSNHSAIPSYRCNPMNRYHHQCPGGGAMAAHLLDREVWARVEAIRLHPEILLREIEQQVAQDDTTEADISAIDGRISQIEREIAKTTRIIAQLDEDVSGDFIGKLNLLGREKKALIADRGEIEARRADLVAGQTLLEQLWQRVDEGMANAETELANLSYQEKRQLLHRLGVKVKLWKKVHEPRYEITTAIDLTQIVMPSGQTITAPFREFGPIDNSEEPLPGKPRWSSEIPDNVDLGPIAERVIADSTSTSCSVFCTT